MLSSPSLLFLLFLRSFSLSLSLFNLLPRFALSSSSTSFLCRLRRTSIPHRRCALGYPIRRPLRDSFPALSPHGAPSQHLRGRLLPGRSLPASSRLSFNLKSLACTPNHYSQPITLPLYMLHIINYQVRLLSPSFSLQLLLVLPHVVPIGSSVDLLSRYLQSRGI